MNTAARARKGVVMTSWVIVTHISPRKGAEYFVLVNRIVHRSHVVQ